MVVFDPLGPSSRTEECHRHSWNNRLRMEAEQQQQQLWMGNGKVHKVREGGNVFL